MFADLPAEAESSTVGSLLLGLEFHSANVPVYYRAALALGCDVEGKNSELTEVFGVSSYPE